MSLQTSSRRFTNLTPENAALVNWVGDGYPPGLAPLLARLTESGFPTVTVNQGWWPLLTRLDEDLALLAPNYRFARVGEDLGVLDVKLLAEDPTGALEERIWGAQSESARTCEVCADRGWPYRQEDWLITLCVDDARARGARPARTDADIAEAIPRAAEREMAFALSAGAPASAFTAGARRANKRCSRASQEADDAEMSTWMSSTAVARLMGVAVAEVNRFRRQGKLSAGRRVNGRYVYPRWQFNWRNQPLEGLPDVIASVQGGDAVGINNAMTTPLEALNELSVAQWLASGQPVSAAVAALQDADIL